MTWIDCRSRCALAAAGLFQLGGCSANLGLFESSNDDEDVGDTDGTAGPGVTEETGTLPEAECGDGRDCGYCSYCRDGECVDEAGSCECATVDPSKGFRCSPPYECYDDFECGVGETCDPSTGTCIPDVVPDELAMCPAVPFEIAVWSVAGYPRQVAVADLDDDGAPELWVAGSDRLTGLDPTTGETLATGVIPEPDSLQALLVDGPDRLVATTRGSPLNHTVLGITWMGAQVELSESAPQPDHRFGTVVEDLDGDGEPEILVATTGGLTPWRFTETGPIPDPTRAWSSNTSGPIALVEPANTEPLLLTPALTFFDLQGEVVERTVDGAPHEHVSSVLRSGPTVDGVATTLLASHGYDAATTVFLATSTAESSSTGPRHGLPGEANHAIFADLRGDAALEAVLATDSWMSVIAFDGTDAVCFSTVMHDALRDLEAGDVDSDGRPDAIALGSNGSVTIVRHGE
jgi:hypothetical protein